MPLHKGRPLCPRLHMASAGFNPRPREGATLLHRRIRLLRGFNPRPAKGRPGMLQMRTFGRQFQSTPPRRGDAMASLSTDTCACFNPRPREGATVNGDGKSKQFLVSIHAPAKGRRPCSYRYPACFLFQSTPPRRGGHGAVRIMQIGVAPNETGQCSQPGGRSGTMSGCRSYLIIKIHYFLENF
jgi:hypothetical protein